MRTYDHLELTDAPKDVARLWAALECSTSLTQDDLRKVRVTPTVRRARQAMAYLMAHNTHLSTSEIGLELNLSNPGVTYCIERVKHLLKVGEKPMVHRLERIVGCIEKGHV